MMERTDALGKVIESSIPNRSFRHYKSSDSNNSSINIHEDELNLTREELSMFYKAAQRMTERITTTDAILKTRIMRDQEKMKLLKKYPIIKIKFKIHGTDDIIETTFESHETVSDMYQFLSIHLTSISLKSLDSIGIYTVRPHKLLSFNTSQNSSSLFDLGLYPASTLIVKTVPKTTS